MVMFRGSLNNYQLSAYGEDLQDNPPCLAQQSCLQKKEWEKVSGTISI